MISFPVCILQVYIRIKDDEWNVYRRYAEFRSLHRKLQNKYQQVRTFNFPPKKAIGNKVLTRTGCVSRAASPSTHTQKEATGRDFLLLLDSAGYFCTDFALISCRFTVGVVNASIFPLTEKKTGFIT